MVYVDGFGNLMSGLRATLLGPDGRLAAAGRELRFARTFSEVAPGEPFWYANSCGLAEVAVNHGSAAAVLGMGLGSRVAIGGTG